MATTAPTTTAPTTGLAAQMAADMAASAVPGMMTAVKNAKKIGMVLLALCLVITFPHAGEFLASLPHVGWAGWVIAALFDAGMLILAQIIQTAGLVKQAKQRATIVLTALGLIAGTTQMVAPGELGIKLLFVSVVGLGLGTKWVIAAVKPDFQFIAQAETAAVQTVAAIAPTAPAGRKCAPGCACGKHAPKPAAKPATRTAKPAAKKATATAPKTPTALPRRIRTTGPVLPPATPLGELSDPAVLMAVAEGLRSLETSEDIPNN